MRARTAALLAGLVFTGVLATLTIIVLVQDGPDVLTFISLLVVGLFGFGIVGALREPPHDD
jgi:hypothetical protein